MNISWNNIISSINMQSDRFLIAVSGGVDSVLLLDVIARSSIPKENYAVVHFNHNIRHDSSDDAEFVGELCKKYGIEFICGHTNELKEVKNLEKMARISRWNFFEEIAKENGYDTIMTAHHLNDYVENYMIGNIRGIDFKSCIMPRVWEHNNVHRFKPWLKEISKEDIYKIAKIRRLEWREDYTNKINDNLRNIVRNKIIPEMMGSHNVLKTIPNVIDSVIK